MGKDLVDDRRLRDERDDAHDAVAGGTRERVDFEDLLCSGAAHRRAASVGASRGAETTAGGAEGGSA
ncbi:hypothetical protein [Gemmatimonas aurantiaca]|uniref:hypothetical protein n=1 Tax=Gemmatimonas aurantiaca TaxID=173480 RepID=UPI00301CAC40